MSPREERGLITAATSRLSRNADGTWRVPSQTQRSETAFYTVNLESKSCTCPDCSESGFICKHYFAASIVHERDVLPDGTVIEQNSLRSLRKRSRTSKTGPRTTSRKRQRNAGSKFSCKTFAATSPNRNVREIGAARSRILRRTQYSRWFSKSIVACRRVGSRQETIVNRDLTRVTTVYDARGRVEATADRLGNRTTSVYDAGNGDFLATIDQLGNRTTTVYDAYGRIVATKRWRPAVAAGLLV